MASYMSSRSAVAEAFRTIRTSLNYTANKQNTKTILITSVDADDGKTLVSANLATSLAHAGEKVLLIDADMRRPACHRELSLPNRSGVTNVLADSEDPFSVIQTTEVAGLHVMTSGPIPPNAAELLDGKALEVLLATVRSEFDHVLIDSPPAGLLADASILASRVDGIILVVVSGVTRVEAAQEVKESLELARGKILGVVLNKVRYPSRDYRYRYRYYEYGEKEKGDA